MARVVQVYHADHPFAETYEKFAEALQAQKDSLKQEKLRVRHIESVGNKAWKLSVPLQDMLTAKPQEDWGFFTFGSTPVSGKVTRVEAQHSYLIVKSAYDLESLGIREIWLKPMDFLSSLRNWASQQSGPLPRLYRQLGLSQAGALSQPLPEGLRKTQLQALAQAQPGKFCLWGPPGTGKTFTVGRIVASLVGRRYRVVVLAPTNVAVDLAALQIDEAFARMGTPLQQGQLLRAGTPHLEELEDRRHLMGWQLEQEEVRARKRELQRLERQIRRQLAKETRPSQQLPLDEQLQQVTEQLKSLETHRQRRLRDLVAGAQVMCCTVHTSYQRVELATFCESGRVAVVYDEAGMVPRMAQVPMMALLSGDPSPAGQLDTAPREVVVVYSGDPKQLGPITQVKAQDVNAIKWTRDSLMEELPPNTVMLVEQSRMEPPICQMISQTYYDGRLVTLPDPQRLEAPLVAGWPLDSVILVDPSRSVHLPMHPDEDPRDLARAASGRNFDEKSVRVGALLIQQALQGGARSVLWLTPFRDQALRLRQAADYFFGDDLEARAQVQAGTVHVSQGSEADLVVFDPVRPGNRWLKSDEPDIHRLINVALSRARTQIIVLTTRNQIRHTPLFLPLHICEKDYRVSGSPQDPRLHA